MRGAISLLIALFCSLWALAAPGGAQDLPAYTDVYVDDFANLLDAGEEAQIRADLTALYNDTGIEAVVVTMATMRDYGHDGQIEPFATRLFNFWGVGDAARNDGVMMLVARDDRQMRIELGAGYPAAMDARMQDIIDPAVLPRFKQGQYDTGILAGVDRLVQILSPGAAPAEPLGFTDHIAEQARRAGSWLLAIILGALASLGAGGYALWLAWQRSRPRYCSVDGQRMVLMGEASDDLHLQSPQVLEENLGSVNYDVWSCPTCSRLRIEGHRSWFTRYSACRACGFRTVEGDRTVIREATTTSTGLERIDYHCLNCGDRHSTERTIPKKSSSSSRSSFGGGHSSGGGASGRW